MTFIKKSGFVFGVPDEVPVIRGFAIQTCAKDWLKATQGARTFIVEILPKFFRLSPFVPTITNPEKMGVDTSKSINIPR